MGYSPQNIETKIRTVLNAWRNRASKKSFGGITLEEFEAMVQPSLDARERIAKLQDQLKAEQNRRDDFDKASMEKVQAVINGVIGDPSEGPNGDLYEAMGYVRKSERKTGLTRKKNTTEQKP